MNSYERYSDLMSSNNQIITQDPSDYFFWAKKVWNVIHILGSSFNCNTSITSFFQEGDCPSNQIHMRKMFICFFISLSKLLPQEESRNSLSSFLEMTPLNKYLEDQMSLLWTYKLHLYINSLKAKKGSIVSAYTYDDLLFIYNPKRITKDVWGPLFWFLLHFLARSLPEKLDRESAIAFKALIVSLQCLLPCGVCRGHLHEHLMQFPLDNYLYSRDSTFEWTWSLHNKVDESIKKPIYSLEQARIDYMLYPIGKYSGPINNPEYIQSLCQ